MQSRVLTQTVGALQRLERHKSKDLRADLRGLGGSNVTWLPGHQGLSCKNKPPGVAFPNLPALPSLPLMVNPDSWLKVVDGMHFVRKVRSDGGVSIDKFDYYVGKEWAGKYVGLAVVAEKASFVVQLEQQTLKEIPIKGLYKRMLNITQWQEALQKEAVAEQRGWRPQRE